MPFRVSSISLLAALLLAPLHGVVARQPPNILFILTDQHHANMLSSAGNPYLKTHALDKMAKAI